MINTLQQQCRCAIFFWRCEQANGNTAVAHRHFHQVFHKYIKLNPSLLNLMCLLRVHQPVDRPQGKVTVSSLSVFLSFFPLHCIRFLTGIWARPFSVISQKCNKTGWKEG